MGYVGLPLAVESGKHYPTKGYDISATRIAELSKFQDRTKEVSSDEIRSSHQLLFSSQFQDLLDCNFYIVTVPTPIDDSKRPDLFFLTQACKSLSEILKENDIVVFESTVYPGCTQEVCVPILAESGLTYNQDFFCGYSPERINPGDKTKRLKDIVKVTSGSSEMAAKRVNEYYDTITEGKTFVASSIEVAEAAKVIENAQRDINIAFVNELAMIFERMGLDTLEVLEAAGTKWNFLPFKPGLVGGHCIGVDPYYLTFQAEKHGFNPNVILAGRRTNDHMGVYIAGRIVKTLLANDIDIVGAKALVMGVTFKENCPDVRNSKVVDIVRELEEFNLDVDVSDPEADAEEVKNLYQITIKTDPDFEKYKLLILAVGHDGFSELDWENIASKIPFIFDVKGFLPKELVNSRL